MSPSDDKLRCKQCGAEYPFSAIVTTCAKCGAPLEVPPPTIDLPPAPDLAAAVAAMPVQEPATAEKPAAKEEPEPPLPLLAPPPRPVPLPLRLEVLFGGAVSQFGWLFLAFGLAVSILILRNLDWPMLPGPRETVQGAVTDTTRTGWHESGGRHSGPIYALHYSFTTPDGAQHEGVSYSVGRQLDPGTPVTVEYPSGHPAASRIQGFRRGRLPILASLVLLFPLFGAAFAGPGLVRGVRALRVLADGRPARGTLKSQSPTGTVINNRPVMRLVFEFTADGGAVYEAAAQTCEPERLRDERRELLLYEPLNPTAAVMIDSLPRSPIIDESGNFRPRSPVRAWASALLPLLIVGGLAAYFVLQSH